ncbi:MAG TPA: hypothetical protein VF939_20920 [Puia sp.]
MSSLTEKIGPEYQPVRLTDAEKDDPYAVLESVFWDYSLGELRSSFAEVTEACLTTDNDPFDRAEKRADLLLLFKNLERFVEAGWLIVLRWEKARPPPA